MHRFARADEGSGRLSESIVAADSAGITMVAELEREHKFLEGRIRAMPERSTIAGALRLWAYAWTIFSAGAGLSSAQGTIGLPGTPALAWQTVGPPGTGASWLEEYEPGGVVEPALGAISPADGVRQGPMRGEDQEFPPESSFQSSGFDESGSGDWVDQWLPDGLVYRSYLAGAKEPRLATVWQHDVNQGWLWDATLGGRVAIWRYGTTDGGRPDGWEVQLEGAAMPRLDPEEERDVLATDFRAGLPVVFGWGPLRSKFAYYHLSSHLGDEFMLKNPSFRRINYSRDVLVWGQEYYLTDDWLMYGEAGWAFYSDVSGEWEFQFGLEYSPVRQTGYRGAPFFAFNGALREELNFSGNLVVQAGWQWRQPKNGHLLRAGMEYYNGKSNQFELFDQFENKIGLGIWFDY